MEEGKRLASAEIGEWAARVDESRRGPRAAVAEYLNDVNREKAIFREGRRITLNVEKLAQFLKGVA
ncbi:MAG: hypothetical protein WCH75_17195 [Candidatus Binatia bacterium]